MTWQPIETAPHGKPVLIVYKNVIGNYCVIKAIYHDKFSEQSMEDHAEYDESTDDYYVPEGWYELVDNWDEYYSIAIYNENKPTHWMPLPEPPEDL